MILEKKFMNEIKVFSSNKIVDSRGYFTRAFCKKTFKKYNADNRINQINFSFNKKIYTLRGYHYQKPSYEAKTISCVNGKIFLSILNLNSKSKYYLKTCNTILDEKDNKFCYIPKKFATAFLTLKKNSFILYYMSNEYINSQSQGIRWNDPIIKEKWPYKPKIISERDKSFEDFN